MDGSGVLDGAVVAAGGEVGVGVLLAAAGEVGVDDGRVVDVGRVPESGGVTVVVRSPETVIMM